MENEDFEKACVWKETEKKIWANVCVFRPREFFILFQL